MIKYSICLTFYVIAEENQKEEEGKGAKKKRRGAESLQSKDHLDIERLLPHTCQLREMPWRLVTESG